MRTLFIFLFGLAAWLSISLPSPVVAGTVATSPSPPPGPAVCRTIPDEKGILIKNRVESQDGGVAFTCYFKELLSQNMIYVILIAVTFVVYSGVEYMLAAGNSAQQGKAKERIIGIIAGLIFYFMITYIAQLLAPGLAGI